jgi:hypothetical protein
MELHPDFSDLLLELANAKVRYLVIGGYAVSFHARPRYTKDIDIWIGKDSENREHAAQALLNFGAPQSIVHQLRTAQSDDIVWIGLAPLRVDFLQEVPGVDFQDSYSRRIESTWNSVSVSIISKEDLIKAKAAAGRPQDLLDIDALQKSGV